LGFERSTERNPQLQTPGSKLSIVLGLFRNNQFTTAILLAFYVGLTHLAALLGRVEPPDAGGMDGVLYRVLFFWADEKHAFWSAAGAAVLVFVQALSVNRLADEFRLLDDRNWLPGLFYAFAAVSLPDFLFLSPPLVAATFLPSVLRRIFRVYKQPKATSLIFDAAFWTMVASLFYPPAIFLLVAVYAGINVMRSFNFREQMVMLTGVLVPVFLAWLWYFWTDRGSNFWGVQFNGLFEIYRPDLQFDWAQTLSIVLFGLLILTTLVSYGTYIFRKLIQIQKCVAVLYWFLFVGGLTVFLQNAPAPSHFMLMMPSLGIFLAMSFSALGSRMIADVFHLVLLGFVFFIQFFSFFSKFL